MKIGKYIYDSERDIVRRTFGEGRHLTFVRASAYDAGIVGSEYNGIAVLDDDNGSIVLDRELNGNPGLQEKLLDSLRTATFADVQTMVSKSKRTRPETSSDLTTIGADPLVFNPLGAMLRGVPLDRPKGPSILDADARRANESEVPPYHFPDVDRVGAILELCKHSMHAEYHGSSRLAWNVKVNGHIDLEAKSEASNDALDPLWNRVTAHPEFFYTVCADAMRPYMDREHTPYPGDDQGDWEFTMEGRSSGWLVLSKWRGIDFSAESINELAGALDELSDEDLAAFYRGILCLDQDLANPTEAFNGELVALREAREENWAEEPVEAIAWAAENGVHVDDLVAAAADLGVSREDVVTILQDEDIEFQEDQVSRLASTASATPA